MTRVIHGLDELRALTGTRVGVSQWHLITQRDIDAFARATGDHQWIHVDAARAAESPLGTTIAHGFLTLSLIPMFMGEVVDIVGPQMQVNYGSDKVRFPSMLPVNSEVRASVDLVTLSDVDKGTLAQWRIDVERAGSEKPVCVAELVTLVMW